MAIPSPRAVSLFLLATAGSIYGLFETLTSISDSDSFLTSPFVSDQIPTDLPTLSITASAIPNPASIPTTQSSQTPSPDPGTSSSPIPIPPQTTVTVGAENTLTGQEVSITVPKNPSNGNASMSQTKINDPTKDPTVTPVVTGPSPKPSTKPVSANSNPRSTSTRPSKNTSTTQSNRNNLASSSSKNTPKPASKPLSVNDLSNWYYGKNTIPTAVQNVDANGEDEYDPKEVLERFGRSSWNAIWIQFVDYMLLAPNNRPIWQKQAQNKVAAWKDSSFVKYRNPADNTLNIPLFGKFYLKDQHPWDGKYRPSNPDMVEWNGENLAKACKKFTEWTPWGAWTMLGREEVWNAAWNFCLKPSKTKSGKKPADWWYP